MASTSARSRDRDTARLVDAAIDLFGARGPDAVSLREVAAAAGVNYGLIHQYVGSKDDLVRLAIGKVSADAAARFSADPLDATVDRLVRPGPPPATLRLLAWSLLVGRGAEDLVGRSLGLQALARRLDDEDDAARTAVVLAMSLLFGWRLFGSYLTESIGLGDDAAAATTDVVRAEVLRLLAGDRPTQ